MSSSNFYGLEQLWKYCKIIECGENGELVFLADNLNMFLSKIGGNYDTNLPIAAISVVGPPKTGKSVFANLVVKYLKENGNVTWMNDLEDGTRLTGFEYGHGLNTVTYDCLSPDSNSSGIYIYPEFFENPDSPNIKFLILVLHIHIIGRVSWKGEHDAIHLLLSLLCSHIIEIQRVKGVNQVLKLDGLPSVWRFQHVCSTTSRVGRGMFESFRDTSVFHVGDWSHKSRGVVYFTKPTTLKFAMSQIFQEKIDLKQFQNSDLTLRTLVEFTRWCVRTANETLKIWPMEPDSKSNDTEQAYQKFSKIITRNGNQQLELHEANLSKILMLLTTDSQASVILLAVIGPPQVGKSMWTNLLVDSLTHRENLGWQKSNQYIRGAVPLRGFSYGYEDIRVTEGCLVPDSSISGIYIWPKAFKLNPQKHVCILHVNYSKEDPYTGPTDSLQLFLMKCCSLLIELTGRNVEKGPLIVQSAKYLPEDGNKGTASILIQRNDFQAADEIRRKFRQHLHSKKDIEFFYVLRNNRPIHDKKGNLTENIHYGHFFERKEILEENRLLNIQSRTTFSNLTDYLKKQISLPSTPRNIATPTKISFEKTISLGKGSFGRVYQGSCRGMAAAVKVISTIAFGKKIALAEIRTLLLCDEESQDNVLKCYAIEERNDDILIALELCKSNLKEWVASKEKCIEPAIIKDFEICQQVSAGLQYLHHLNIIHRDLKPENILLSMSSSFIAKAKIADFGLCKIIPADKSHITITSASGSPGWMAPELLEFLDYQEQNPGCTDKKMSTALDVFSLGCVFYFTATAGKHPFGDVTRLRERNISDNKHDLRYEDVKRQELSQIIPIISGMINNNPGKRPKIEEVFTVCTHLTQFLYATEAISKRLEA